MIIFKPCCGLGNQMFLYAAAKALALRHKTRLLADMSYYSDESQRKLPAEAGRRFYELDRFNVTTEELPGYEGMIIRRVRSRRFLKKMHAIVPCLVCRALGSRRHFVHYCEKGPRFDKTVLRLPDNVILEGYFVSYKYFEDCGDVIRRDLAFRQPPDGANQNLLNEIAAVNAVSIHVRRGDYITNKVVTERFGLCSLDYYRRAVQHVAQKVQAPVFYVFSDDPEWSQQHLKIDYPCVYVTHNTLEKGYEDIRLMTACKHNIIANSTFSWWGAWLNPNPDKAVVCPTPAFDQLDITDDDWYPPTWDRLPKN